MTLAVTTLVISTNATAAIFPVDSEWVAATTGGVVVTDAEGDSAGYFDIVGDDANAAFYLSANDDDLFFRLRLDENPYNTSTGKFNAFAFDVLFDTDGNASNYEYSLIFDGPNSEVVFSQNTVFDSNWATDIAELTLNIYPESNVRVVSANTNFGLSSDFFIDISMSITDLNTAGIYLSDGLSVAACTSANPSNCLKDIAGFETTDPIQFSDPVHLSSVPVPAAAWLFGSGLIGLVGLARRKKQEG